MLRSKMVLVITCKKPLVFDKNGGNAKWHIWPEMPKNGILAGAQCQIVSNRCPIVNAGGIWAI